MEEFLLNKREESFYDWNIALNSLKKNIRNDLCSCILISAPFGWGKSSFTNILKNELEEELKNNREKSWDIYINDIWKYELLNSDEIISVLLYDIIDTFFKILINKYMPESFDFGENSVYKYALINEKIVKGYTKELFDGILKKILNKKLTDFGDLHKSEFIKILERFVKKKEDSYFSLVQLYEKFQNAFLLELDNITGNKNAKILLIFRDIDRCSPENILKIIDSLYHININSRIKFIIEADEHSIKSILSRKYHFGNYFDFLFDSKVPTEPDNSSKYKFEILNGYLDKVFDLIIRLERRTLNSTQIKSYLLSEFNIEIDVNYISFHTFPRMLYTNYRFIKKSIQNLFNNYLDIKQIPKELSIENRSIIVNALIVIILINDFESFILNDFELPFWVAVKDYEFAFKQIKGSEYEQNGYASSLLHTKELQHGDIKKFLNSVKIRMTYNIHFPVFNILDSYIERYDQHKFEDFQQDFNNLINSINDLWKFGKLKENYVEKMKIK